MDSNVYGYGIESCTSLNLTSVSRIGDTLDFEIYFNNNNTNCYKVEGLWSINGTTWYNDAVTTHTGCTSPHIITTEYPLYDPNNGDNLTYNQYYRYFKLKKTCKNGTITYSNEIVYEFPESDFIYGFRLQKGTNNLGFYRTNDTLRLMINDHLIGSIPTKTGHWSQIHFGTYYNITYNEQWYGPWYTFSDAYFLNSSSNILTLTSIIDQGGKNIFDLYYWKFLVVNSIPQYFHQVNVYYLEWNHGTDMSITFTYPELN